MDEHRKDQDNQNNEHNQNEQDGAQTEPEKLTQEEESFQSKFMRLQADFQNYKRRTESDKLDWIKVGQVKIIEKFLPIIDDLERALSAANEHMNEDAHKEGGVLSGFLLIDKNLKKILQDLDVELIDCSEKFNPELHEALMQVESDQHESGQIVSVLMNGYQYKGMVIRHAKVSVAK